MATNNAGQVEGTYTSLPFGDAFNVNGTDDDLYHFAGMDYDYSSGYNGTAHAQFRQYDNGDGSWMSPDLDTGSYDFNNPQSLNRYSYVMNNPASFVDPSGLQEGGGGCGFWCNIPVVYFLHCLFSLSCGGSSFNGTLTPRPNGQPWDEYHIQYGPNIAAALGLPDESCDFGACGGIPSDNFGPGLVTAGAGTVICQIAEPCGAIEDGLFVGGLVLTGAAAIWEMSQHGRGNVADTGIENEARQQFPNLDMCSALDLLMRAAKAAGDTQKQMRIKKTQKAYGCRQSRG